MNYGFIKVATATPSIRVADCLYNKQQIAAAMRQAAEQQVHLLVLPELCLTGYTCGDLFLQKALLDGAEKALFALLEESRDLPLLTLVGLPVRKDGKLYNCAAVLQEGRLLGVVPKTHIPNYNEFYERRHFTSAPAGNSTITLAGQECPFGAKLLFSCAEQPDFLLAAEICEDLWVPCPPSIAHAAAGATVIANLSASDETIGKADYRRQLVTGQAARLVCGYLYADAGKGESTTDLVFSGHSLIAENGRLLGETAPFADGLLCREIDVELLAGERRRMTTFPFDNTGYTTIPFFLPLTETKLSREIARHPFVPAGEDDRQKRCEAILAIQTAGLQKRLEHTNAKAAVIGISGGLDSTLALLVTVRAMDRLDRPRSDIQAVTMPCFGTTARTRSNAEILCERLGVSFSTISIAAAVEQHFADIAQDPQNYDAAYENAQARERTQVLMDIANQTGGLVVGTGDLSELALGWATYNGDHMSMYGVNASIPKTLVRHLVAHAAAETEDSALRDTLEDILATPVSPELLPPTGDDDIAQKTEELVGPYELHDFFLYYMLRFGFAPSKIFYLAVQVFAGEYTKDVIRFWLKTFYRRFFSQQFKRSCLPDGPKVGSVALSPRGDWRMPSDASAALWLAEIEALEA